MKQKRIYFKYSTVQYSTVRFVNQLSRDHHRNKNKKLIDSDWSATQRTNTIDSLQSPNLDILSRSVKINLTYDSSW